MELKTVIINVILIPALQELYTRDFDNILFGVSERNICARLAHHMENLMRRYDEYNKAGELFEGYFVDVEYNRMGKGDLKNYENTEHRPQYMVSDLLIHTRGGGRNLLAVELKKYGNYRNAKNDRDRLRSIVSENDISKNCVHNTFLGAFIVYSSKGARVELYENIKGEGKKTEEFFWNSLSNCQTKDIDKAY